MTAQCNLAAHSGTSPTFDRLSVSHTKSSIVGASVTIPILNGKLQLGTWQGVYLLEYRALPHSRKVVATVM